MRPILITAGATRNPIDSMRYISAHSKGGTGVWLADQLQVKAYQRRVATGGPDCSEIITILGSPVALEKSKPSAYLYGCHRVEFGSTRDLMNKMEDWIKSNPGGTIIHSAAVGDYEVAEASDSKISSGLDELTIKLQPTPKILDHIRRWDPNAFIVSFKAAAPKTEKPALQELAMNQLKRTDSAMVFANVIGDFGKDILITNRECHSWFKERTVAMQHLVESIPLEG